MDPLIVTELRQISQERFEVGLSDGSAVKVGLNQIADFSLFVGRELDAEELDALRAAAGRQRCRERAMRIIGARAMSERELYDRLVEKGEDERDAADAVAWLLQLHFLNDESYAESVIRSCAAKGYGKRRAQQELQRRKLPRELWDAALEGRPEPDETIDRLLRSRLRGADPDDRAALKKASDALLRRGFGWDEIKDAVERWKAGLEE